MRSNVLAAFALAVMVAACGSNKGGGGGTGGTGGGGTRRPGGGGPRGARGGQQVVHTLPVSTDAQGASGGGAAIGVAEAPDPPGFGSGGVPLVENISSPGRGPPYQVNGQCTMSADTSYFAVFPHMHTT